MIVKFTSSPTLVLTLSEVLIIVKFTLGSTVTLVTLDGTSVVFSVEFTTTKLLRVPLVNTLTAIQNDTEVPFSSLSIVQVIF